MHVPSLFKPSKRKIILLIILILIAGLVFYFFGQKKSKPKQYATVLKQDIESTVSSSGILTGKDSANLKFKISGKLSYIKVKVGDIVNKNDLIAGLDTQDLDIALQQARNTLTDKQATLANVYDQVKDHSSDETFTQRQTRTTAETASNNAYDSVKAAQRAYQDAVISTPISGIVTQAIPVSGQVVTGSDVIAQIVDTSEIYFDTDVDESDVSKVAIGLPADVTLDAYPGQLFKGVVNQVLPQTKVTSSGATVVTVRIKLDNPPAVFVNGLSGEASIITSTVTNALIIPQEALRDDSTVVELINNKLVEKKVDTGILSDTNVEIKSGLSEGEKVLLNPPSVGSKLN